MVGTWNFYSVFGGADTARGLLLPRLSSVFPIVSSSPEQTVFPPKASHLLAVPSAACHGAGREGLVREPGDIAASGPCHPWLLLECP